MELSTLLTNPEQLLQNQFLVGIVGGMGLGAVGYVARSVPRKIMGLLESTFSTYFTISTRYKQYDQVAVLLQRYAIQAIMRNFAPAKSNEVNSYYRPRKTQKMPPNLAPGYGSGWGWFEGKLMRFTRQMMESKGDELHEQIAVRFFTRDVGIVSRFLNEAEGLEDAEFLKLHLQQSDYFGSPLRKIRRSMDTVFMPEAVKRRLTERFQWFVNNEAWYRDRGIPYKFCAVLHGPPGTGKTSLVHAIATEFDLAINYVTSLSSIQSLLSECTPQDLIVIEDIDTLAPEMNREGTGMKDVEQAQSGKSVGATLDSFVLHRLLNAIDGFCTPHALKVIMTTNHPEKLDPALLRAGRTDLMLEIGPLGLEEIRTMYRAFYPEADASAIHPTGPWKGADLQELFLTHTAEESARTLNVLDKTPMSKAQLERFSTLAKERGWRSL